MVKERIGSMRGAGDDILKGGRRYRYRLSADTPMSAKRHEQPSGEPATVARSPARSGRNRLESEALSPDVGLVPQSGRGRVRARTAAISP